MKAVINEFNSTLLFDIISEIQWEIDNSKTKNMGGYDLTYASGEFTGTNIFAWFTLEIPVSVGP
jgi:GLPGLI family protein